MAAKKTIVVVGAGFYGIWCANRISRLSTGYKVKLISKSDYTYHLMAAVRVAVTNNTEGVVIPLTDVVDKAVEIIKDEVSVMREGSVELKKNGDVSYDVLIVATGASWSEPFGTTFQWGDDYKAFFDTQHKKIEEAKHIVLVGGGINNAELAGELNERYEKELKAGTKKVTIVQSEDKMLANNGHFGDKMRNKVTTFFQKETPIELLLNSKAQFSDDDPHTLTVGGKTIKADLVYHSTGVKPSVPAHEFTDFTNERGFIKVYETFQCVAVPKGNVFAIGDCCDFKLKGIVIHNTWLSSIVPNVKSILDKPDTPRSQLKTSPRHNGLIPGVVSLGSRRCAGQIPVPFFGAISPPEFVGVRIKAKDLMTGKSREMFRE